MSDTVYVVRDDDHFRFFKSEKSADKASRDVLRFHEELSGYYESLSISHQVPRVRYPDFPENRGLLLTVCSEVLSVLPGLKHIATGDIAALRINLKLFEWS